MTVQMLSIVIKFMLNLFSGKFGGLSHLPGNGFSDGECTFITFFVEVRCF
jgi:hypothetical protein